LTFTERAQCVDQLRAAAGSAQFVVVSGSLPPDVPGDFYQQIADVCSDVGTRLILDTSGTGLQHITSGVFLLKPSVRERVNASDVNWQPRQSKSPQRGS
jgi:6-phosphofructokinase 2